MKIAIIVGLISIFDCLRADKFGLSNLQCMISAVVKAQSVMDNILSKIGTIRIIVGIVWDNFQNSRYLYTR